MTRLAASDLTVRRGGRAILDGVSCAFDAGDFVAVIGANGAGKSTLLMALAGLLTPDAGIVALDDRPLKDYGGREMARPTCSARDGVSSPKAGKAGVRPSATSRSTEIGHSHLGF